MFVKICGLSTIETVRAAVDAGADAIGFVLSASPRQVTPETARLLGAEVPPHVLTVAVFGGVGIGEVRRMTGQAGVAAVQLHGDYAKADFDAVKDLSRKLIRGVDFAAPDLRTGAYGEDMLIVDAPRPGSGTAWDYAVLAESDLDGDWMLAGGLTPQTVRDAIRSSRAVGVDVSSGVETSRGIKSETLIRQFIAAARQPR